MAYYNSYQGGYPVSNSYRESRESNETIRSRDATISNLKHDLEREKERASKNERWFMEERQASQNNSTSLAKLTKCLEDLRTSEETRIAKLKRNTDTLIAQHKAKADLAQQNSKLKDNEIDDKNTQIIMLQRIIFKLMQNEKSIPTKTGIRVETITPKAKKLLQTLLDKGEHPLPSELSEDVFRSSVLPHLRAHVAIMLTKLIEETGLKRPGQQKRPQPKKSVPVCLLQMETKLIEDPEYTIDNFKIDFQNFIDDDVLIWKDFSIERAAEMNARFLKDLDELLAFVDG